MRKYTVGEEVVCITNDSFNQKKGVIVEILKDDSEYNYTVRVPEEEIGVREDEIIPLIKIGDTVRIKLDDDFEMGTVCGIEYRTPYQNSLCTLILKNNIKTKTYINEIEKTIYLDKTTTISRVEETIHRLKSKNICLEYLDEFCKKNKILC